jgi:hypothetical protein
MTSQRVQIGVSKLQPNVELRVFDGITYDYTWIPPSEMNLTGQALLRARDMEEVTLV